MCHPHTSSIFLADAVMAMFSKFSMNMLTATGDNGEPMGSPSICAYSFSVKVNTVDLRHSEHRSILRVTTSSKTSMTAFEGTLTIEVGLPVFQVRYLDSC